MAKVEHKPTQNERIIEYIQKFGSITQLQALQDLGIMRLASRINDLRSQGVAIVSEVVMGKNRYGETTHYSKYRLAEEEK
jgi:hypothetical protein